MDEILNKIRTQMEQVLLVVAEDMATIRVGAARPSMVEKVEVEAYGQRMKLMELASISAPSANLILIAPWDKGVIGEIERGILEANLGLTPNVAGEVIRIIFPPLTEERRRDYVKLVHQKLESGRQLSRGVRTEGKEKIEKLKDQSGWSEDDIRELLRVLDETTAEFNKKLEELAAAKEADVMRV